MFGGAGVGKVGLGVCAVFLIQVTLVTISIRKACAPAENHAEVFPGEHGFLVGFAYERAVSELYSDAICCYAMLCCL